jgi:hypothetical protein
MPMPSARPTFLVITGAILVALMAFSVRKVREISNAVDLRPLATSPDFQRVIGATRGTATPAEEKIPQKLQSESEWLDDARFACEEMVRHRLRDPGSAQFEDYGQNEAKRLNPREFEVRVHVLARSDFNVLRPSIVDCKIGSSADRWFPISLKTLP